MKLVEKRTIILTIRVKIRMVKIKYEKEIISKIMKGKKKKKE